MVTIDEVREGLAVNLAPFIGLYTFSNGQTTPAIRVDDGSDPYPEDPKITGLEVVITPLAEVSMVQMIGGYQDTYTMGIMFKQFDQTKTTLEIRSPAIESLLVFPTLQIGNLRRLLRISRINEIEVFSFTATQNIWTPD